MKVPVTTQFSYGARDRRAGKEPQDPENGIYMSGWRNEDVTIKHDSKEALEYFKSIDSPARTNEGTGKQVDELNDFIDDLESGIKYLIEQKQDYGFGYRRLLKKIYAIRDKLSPSLGTCQHQWSQVYDFSKFSNAHNSLKCNKCGATRANEFTAKIEPSLGTKEEEVECKHESHVRLGNRQWCSDCGAIATILGNEPLEWIIPVKPSRRS